MNAKALRWEYAGRRLGKAAEVWQATGAWKRLGHGGGVCVVFSARWEALDRE